MDPFERAVEAIRRFMKWLREYIFGYGNYASPPWEWDMRRQRWVLQGSRSKSYHCTEHICARIESRDPLWGAAAGDGIETGEFLAELARLKWGPEGCRCGCDEGQSKNCVAVYFEKGDVIHAAIFDHVHCDWGGKLGAGAPVARFRRPEDWYENRRVPPDGEIRIYCPQEGGTKPADGQQLTDEELHRRARRGP